MDYNIWLKDSGFVDGPIVRSVFEHIWKHIAKPAYEWIVDNVAQDEDTQRDSDYIKYPSEMLYRVNMLPPHEGTLYLEDGEIQECNIPQREPERSAMLRQLLDGDWEVDKGVYYNPDGQDGSMSINDNASKAVGFEVFGPVIDIYR